MNARSAFAAAAALSLGVVCVPVSSEIRTPLQPINRWAVHHSKTRCDAIRDYGDSTDPIRLLLNPAPNGETYDLYAFRRGPGPNFAEELEGSVDFGPAPIHAWVLHYRRKGDDRTVYEFRISAPDINQARSASAVRLYAGDGIDLTLALTDVSAVLAELDECNATIMRSWNFNGEKDGTIAKLAKGDLRKVFSDEDYPSEATRRQQQGAATFRLFIDEAGDVADCFVEQPSGIPALDEMGCQVMTKRRWLTPARDSQGRPVRSTVITPPINWVLR